MTGVCLFSFPIIKPCWFAQNILIISEYIGKQIRNHTSLLRLCLFLCTDMQQTLADREVSTRARERTRKMGMRQFLSCQSSETPSHKTTSIHRNMTGALLLLNLGVSIPHSCWAHRTAPLAVHNSQPWAQTLTSSISHSKSSPAQDPKHVFHSYPKKS